MLCYKRQAFIYKYTPFIWTTFPNLKCRHRHTIRLISKPAFIKYASFSNYNYVKYKQKERKKKKKPIRNKEGENAQIKLKRKNQTVPAIHTENLKEEEKKSIWNHDCAILHFSKNLKKKERKKNSKHNLDKNWTNDGFVLHYYLLWQRRLNQAIILISFHVSLFTMKNFPIFPTYVSRSHSSLILLFNDYKMRKDKMSYK